MHTHENEKGSIFGAKLLYFEELSKRIVKINHFHFRKRYDNSYPIVKVAESPKNHL